MNEKQKRILIQLSLLTSDNHLTLKSRFEYLSIFFK